MPESYPLIKIFPVLRAYYVFKLMGKTIAMLDAKYKDLWQKNLPENFLHQLSVYALGHTKLKKSTILYLSMNCFARESSLSINNPVHGGKHGIVNLRPVHIPDIVKYIDSGNNLKLNKTDSLNF